MSFSFQNYLKKLERLTHTDLKYLSGGSFWLILTQGIGILSGLLSSTIFARFASPENFGTYRYLLSIYGLLAIFTLPGIRTAMTRSISQGKTNTLSFGIKTQMRAGLIGSLVSLGLASWYMFQGNHLLAIGMVIIAAALPLADTTDISSFFQGQRKFKDLFIYSTSITLSSLITALIGIWLGANPLVLLGLFLGGIATVRGVSLWRVSYLRLTSREAASISDKKDITAFGTQLSLLSIVSIAANSLDKILLFHYLDPVAVANYAFATTLPNQLRGLVRNLGTLALPKFSNRSETEVYKGLLKRLPLLLGAIALMIVGYLIAAPYIFHLLFPRYLPVLPFSQIFCLSILDSVTYPISSAFTAHKKTRILSFFTLSIYVVDLSLLFILTPYLGLQGVIIAKLSSRLLTVVLGAGILYKLTRAK